MKKMRQWVMAATLICGLSVFTACSSSDDDDDPVATGTTEKELLYQWIADYAEQSTDTLTSDLYDRVVKVYEFFDDGTGYYEHYLLKGDELVYACNLRGENGDFEYTVSNDKVTIKLADIYGENDSTWTVSCANYALTDPDGKAFRHSTEAEREQVMAWYESWHGGSAEGTIDLSTVKGNITVKDGSVLTGKLGPYTIAIDNGATVTLHNVDINDAQAHNAPIVTGAIVCKGDVTIILSGTNKVCGYTVADLIGTSNGIDVPENKTLTIKGDGELEIRGGKHGAGIGSSSTPFSKYQAGNLVIESGTIKAYGGFGCPGIGGGYASGSPMGNITIKGGNVSAFGGEKAAGIGGGIKTPCGNITINGGNVYAMGGAYGAGVGAGNFKGSCGDITITGGRVDGTGGQYGAGIGSACSEKEEDGNIAGRYRSITITGGEVVGTAGEDAAGIGTGYVLSGPRYDSRTITITGGWVWGIGRGRGVGIGAGMDGVCGTININTSSGNYLNVEAKSEKLNDISSISIGATLSQYMGTLNLCTGFRLYCFDYPNTEWSWIRNTENFVSKIREARYVMLRTCDHPGYESNPAACIWCKH